MAEHKSLVEVWVALGTNLGQPEGLTGCLQHPVLLGLLGLHLGPGMINLLVWEQMGEDLGRREAQKRNSLVQEIPSLYAG